MKKKLILTISLVLATLLLSGISVNADYKSVSNISMPQKLNDCEIFNITVQEAYDLMTDTGNGIQHPIDVRYDYEWYTGFVDAPYPENTRWYCLDLLKDNVTMQIFCDEYGDKEVIMYCKGGYRSLVACYLLCEANFTGKIYNMIGGINAWIDAGLPIRNNTPPATPEIEGKTKGNPGVEYDYEFSTTDAEGDWVYYYIIWGDESPDVEWTGPYESGEVATISHTFESEGTFNISAQAKDFHGNESEWAEITVKIPRNKAVNFNLFKLLIERFPFIRQLLGL